MEAEPTARQPHGPRPPWWHNFKIGESDFLAASTILEGRTRTAVLMTAGEDIAEYSAASVFLVVMVDAGDGPNATLVQLVGTGPAPVVVPRDRARTIAEAVRAALVRAGHPEFGEQ